MMKNQSEADRGAPLGLFSYLVAASIPILQDNAFGLKITELLIAELKTLIDPGQVYLTLKRLKARGLVRKDQVKRSEGAGVVEGYTLTRDGEQALERTANYIAVASKFSRGSYARKDQPKVTTLSRNRRAGGRQKTVGVSPA